MKPETKFQMRVLRELKKIPQSWFEKISQRTVHGTPDVLGVVGGRFVALELKSEGGKAMPLQGLKLEKIRNAGGIAEVVYPANFEEVLRLLWSFIKDERSASFYMGNEQASVDTVKNSRLKKG